MSNEEPDSIRDNAMKRLQDVREKRGYLLPHHGLLALTAPELLEGYDACYTALTLTKRLLSEREKEFVWIGILTIRDEFIASQHLQKFLDAGGAENDVHVATRMAAFARGASAYMFIPDHWQQHAPWYDGKKVYFEALNALLSDQAIDDQLVNLAMCANHTCRQGWTNLRWHIEKCYELKVPESYLAEAMSYTMFSGSIPYFIEGCGVWRNMIRENEVDASTSFKEWASIDQAGPG